MCCGLIRSVCVYKWGQYRIGRLPKSNGEVSRYARPIKLCLITKQQQSELFGLKENYLKVPKFINVRLANDMNEEELIAYREMKLVYSATKGLTGVSAKLRGATVIIDERVYGKADCDRLPHGLTAESISTRLTPDGVAFQSHLSPLSNLYTCKLMLGLHWDHAFHVLHDSKKRGRSWTSWNLLFIFSVTTS